MKKLEVVEMKYEGKVISSFKEMTRKNEDIREVEALLKEEIISIHIR